MEFKEKELIACRICLEVDVNLYQIQESQLEYTFVSLLGTTFSEWDGFPQHLCGYCRALLRKCSSLRLRCQRSQALLKQAVVDRKLVTMDYLRSIDRVAHKLNINLKTYNTHSSDSTQEIKLDEVKQENDFIENIFVDEPTLVFDDNEFNDYETSDADNDFNKIIDDIKLENNDKKLKRTTDVKLSKKIRKKSITRKNGNKKSIVKTKEKIVNERNKRTIKRRIADNGFLPDFDFDEFQTKYNVKIDILSREEQMREIEEKKMAPSFNLAAFGCEICGKAFATSQVYDLHMTKHSASAGAHACEICLVRFKTKSRAHVHQDTHRLRFTCERCAFVTRTRFIAKNHFLSHAGTTHKCPHCDAIFNKYTSYLTHVRRRHPAMNVACDECGETFVGRNGLRHHKTRAHRSKEARSPKTSQFKCASCDARFDNSEALDRHNDSTKNSCDENLRPCPQCGEPQHSAEALARHMEDRHTPRKHHCQECAAWFVDARSFATHHARVHLNIRVKEPPRARRPVRALICEQCGHECTSLTSLMAHQRSHSGARPHRCPACALSFGSLHNMQRHHRVVHLGQRPQVKCGTCGKLLAHAASLKLHINTVHLKRPPPPRQRRRRDSTV